MALANKIRIKKTPNCLHRYTATMKECGTYGFGDTPSEARASLERQLHAANPFPPSYRQHALWNKAHGLGD